jgi:gluconolactonase
MKANMNHMLKHFRLSGLAGTICGSFLLVLPGTFSTHAQSPVPPGATVEKLATGFQFVEGPVWSDSIGLLFSDMNGNKIYRWTQAGGATAFLDPANNSNGLTYDLQGRLLINQCGLRRVARRDSGGILTSLASTFGGKKLNSPNDIVVKKSDGAIFFTDPPFNIPSGQQQELSFSGVYRISPSGALQLLDSTLKLPNGICFSPDQRKLYVDESQQRIIYVWDVVNDSVLANKRQFATIRPTGYADGMKVDSAGNLYCTGPLGVWVFDSAGVVLDTILVPETPSNCNWGGADRKTLFITAGKSLYRIRLSTTGVDDHSALPAEGYMLMQNYPNPFNPTTKVGFVVGGVVAPSGAFSSGVEGPEAKYVKVAVYDMLGREVAVLMNERREPGTYSVTFDGSNLASGVYLCHLSSGRFSETRAMVLMR